MPLEAFRIRYDLLILVIYMHIYVLSTARMYYSKSIYSSYISIHICIEYIVLVITITLVIILYLLILTLIIN